MLPIAISVFFSTVFFLHFNGRLFFRTFPIISWLLLLFETIMWSIILLLWYANFSFRMRLFFECTFCTANCSAMYFVRRTQCTSNIASHIVPWCCWCRCVVYVRFGKKAQVKCSTIYLKPYNLQTINWNSIHIFYTCFAAPIIIIMVCWSRRQMKTLTKS